jgi:hypothetical protein
VEAQLDQEIARRLLKTRAWSLEGKSRLYRRSQRVTAIDVYFALKRVYQRAQRVPYLGRAATASARALTVTRARLRRG